LTLEKELGTNIAELSHIFGITDNSPDRVVATHSRIITRPADDAPLITKRRRANPSPC